MSQLAVNLLLFLSVSLAFIAVYSAFLFWIFTCVQASAGGGEIDLGIVTRAVSQPSFWILGAVLGTALMALQGLVLHVLQGLPALLALNDPESVNVGIENNIE